MKLVKMQKPIKPAILILLVSVLVMAGITVASYIMTKQESGVVEADKFYFTSNLLKDESEKAIYFVDPKNTSFTVKLYNYADAKRKTAGDIDYSVKVDNGTPDSSTGTITQVDKEKNIVITPTNKNGNVTVTATSTSPYKTELQAKFKMECGNDYTVSDSSGKKAAVLTMICKDAGKPITISLPEGVLPDSNDNRVTKSGSSYIYTSPGYGVYSITLLKTNANLNLSTATEQHFADQITITNSNN